MMPPRVGFPLLRTFGSRNSGVPGRSGELRTVAPSTSDRNGGRKVMSQGWLGVTWMVGSGLRKSGPSAAAGALSRAATIKIKQPSSSPPTKRVRGSLHEARSRRSACPLRPFGHLPARKCAGEERNGRDALAAFISSRFRFLPRACAGEVAERSEAEGANARNIQTIEF